MRVAIVTFPGSAGESEIFKALLSVGFQAEQVEIVDEQVTDLSEFTGVFIPGGAVYANAVRPGAVSKTTPVADALVKFAESGKSVIGIGNGFQILTELDLLPGGFLKNKSLKTVTGLVDIVLEKMNQPVVKLPIAHLFGQYYVTEETLSELKQNNQVYMTYASKNPNGSVANIAGVTNKQGNVIGMMPKPERAMEALLGSEAGRVIFASFFQQITKG